MSTMKLEMVEILPGLWYEKYTGEPWSTRVRGFSDRFDGPLHQIKKITNSYRTIFVDGKNVHWHKLVWEHFNGAVPEGFEIDHKNNERLDNRIENLQLLTHADNARKCKVYVSNTSGYPGVSWNKHSNKWRVTICHEGNRMSLGYFDDAREGFQTYVNAKIKYHGAESIEPIKHLIDWRL